MQFQSMQMVVQHMKQSRHQMFLNYDLILLDLLSDMRKEFSVGCCICMLSGCEIL